MNMSKIDVSDAFIAGLGLAMGLTMGQYMTQAMKPTRKAIRQVIICPKCGNRNPVENKFCGICGQALYPPSPTQCPRCNTAMPPNISFCRMCGFPLKKVDQIRKKRKKTS
jgi:rRNA maturation endonuclease Nob1